MLAASSHQNQNNGVCGNKRKSQQVWDRALKVEWNHSMLGGKFGEADEEDEDSGVWRWCMQFNSLLGCLLAIIQLFGTSQASIGWKILKNNKLHDRFEYNDVGDFLIAAHICLAFAVLVLLGHFLVGICSSQWGIKTNEMMLAGTAVSVYTFIFCMVYMSVTIEFLMTIQKTDVGYCSSGENLHRNHGCYELLTGFELIRNVGILLITVHAVTSIIYSDILCKGDINAIPDYGSLPPELPPLPADDDDEDLLEVESKKLEQNRHFRVANPRHTNILIM